MLNLQNYTSWLQALDDIDLKFKLATSGVGEHFAEDLASGARRPQRASAYGLLKQVGFIIYREKVSLSYRALQQV